MQCIEYIHNPADKVGEKLDPAKPGMPPAFPLDSRHVATFKGPGNGRAGVTVTDYGWSLGRMLEVSEMGLKRCLGKMGVVFGSRS